MRRATRPCACALLLALLGLHAAAFRFRSPPPISARGLHLGTSRPAAVVRVPARLGRRPIICLGRAAPADVATHLVWYTGCADLRIHDHGGLIAAASSGARCIPVFVLDDQLHLEMPENLLRRLHGALVGLDNDLASAYGGRLIYREGDSSRLLVELAKESKATVVHVLADEITYSLSAQRRATRAALDKAGVELRMWTTDLRQEAPWSSRGAALTNLPLTYAQYAQQARALELTKPRGAPDALSIGRLGKDAPADAAAAPPPRSELPSPGQLLERADSLARRAARARASFPTTEPFDHVVQGWTSTAAARAVLAEYLSVGRSAFADRHFYEAMPMGAADEEEDDEDAEDEEEDEEDEEEGALLAAEDEAAMSEAEAAEAAALLGAGARRSQQPRAPETAGAVAQLAAARAARRGGDRELARAGGGSSAAELGELRRGGMRVGMAEPPEESGMPRGPRAAGFGSVEELDNLVPVGDAQAADLWPAAGKPAARAGAPAERQAAAGGAAEGAGGVDVAVGPPSLHAAAAQWLLPHVPRGGVPGADGGAPGGVAEVPRKGVVAQRLAVREVATRALATALSLGCLSPREVYAATAEAASLAVASGTMAERLRATLSGQAWGRSDMGALIDLLEWREWHRLLARRDLEEQRQQTTAAYYAPSTSSAQSIAAVAAVAAAAARTARAGAAVAERAQQEGGDAAADEGGGGKAVQASAVATAAAAVAEAASAGAAGTERALLGLAPAAGGEALALEREQPAYGFWRWGGQHLVRFAVWPSDADVQNIGGAGGAHSRAGQDGEPLLLADTLLDALVAERGAAARGAASGASGGGREAGAGATQLLFVHGFGASSQQWARLARQLRLQMRAQGLAVPRMYAIDLLGFGHSEKPGLSYTQHLWEASLVDFALEVMGAQPFVAVGNSIGGGLAAGLASNLRGLCRGLVLCNSAGRIDEPAEYAALLRAAEEAQREAQAHGGEPIAEVAATIGSATLRVRDHPSSLGEIYVPPPLGGQPLLDAFGWLLINWLLPQVAKLVRSYYPARPAAADQLLVDAIVRDGSDPGAPNVIASGQKLPPQRPLNEVLSAQHGFGGPVLVPQGKDDPLSGAERSQKRAAQLGRLRSGVTVQLLDAGHCPHDEVADQVAAAIVGWWGNVEK